MKLSKAAKIWIVYHKTHSEKRHDPTLLCRYSLKPNSSADACMPPMLKFSAGSSLILTITKPANSGFEFPSISTSRSVMHLCKVRFFSFVSRPYRVLMVTMGIVLSFLLVCVAL